MIEEIEIRKLHQHPKNVRRTYGDLAELTESIKEVGILQNLTVVPDPAIKGEYLVVIGNCRLQAARQAGLKTVPCSVVDMTEEEQISTMLVENMQRKNLSIIEEAKGVQMCIDLGTKPADLAKKTGLSKRVIYERKAIAELDIEDESPEATIQDYLKVTELKDKENRDELLKVIGTNNFQWKYSELKRKEEYAAFFKTLTPYLAGHATEVQDRPKWNEYTDYFQVESKADIDKINWEKDAEYCFCKSQYQQMIMVYKMGTEEEEDEDDLEEYERQKERKSEAKKQAYVWEDIARTSRMNYMRELYHGESGPISKDKLIFWLTKTLIFFNDWDEDIYLEAIEAEEPEEYEDDTALQEMLMSVRSISTKAIMAVYSSMETRKDSWLPTMTGYGTYQKSESYQELYDFMHDFGYRPSQEEKKLLDGTHEIYIKEDEEEDDE